jgi:hypothetical protein
MPQGVTSCARLGYDSPHGTLRFSQKETRAMGDKSPKNTSKTNKQKSQKSQKKDAKSSKK